MMLRYLAAGALALAFTLDPAVAFAYIGPGAGISAIGSALALIAAVLLAIVGFVWYPLKRLLRGRRKEPAGSTSSTNENAPS